MSYLYSINYIIYKSYFAWYKLYIQVFVINKNPDNDYNIT